MRQANNSFLFYASGRRFCSALKADLELRRRQDIFAQVSGRHATVGSLLPAACRRIAGGWHQHSSLVRLRTSPARDFACTHAAPGFVLMCTLFHLSSRHSLASR